MAASPDWKVYDADKKYRAATKDVEDAAVLVAFYGDGATIRYGHDFVVWTEGKEFQPAAESYDFVHEVAVQRINEAIEKRRRLREAKAVL